MEMSESIAALSAALSKAQLVMEGAIKGKVNPAFKSRYADLASVWDACREPLASNGLSVIQMPGRVENGQMSLTTQINHASGEWVRETMSIPLSKVDAQGYGSATSYARRYALAAFVGVSPDDDDGNGAVKNAPKVVYDTPPPATRAAPLKGPHTSKTGLKTALHDVVREIEACGDIDQLEAFLAMPETKATIAQCERDAPEWAVTGEGMPDEFVPLLDRIAKLRTELTAAANEGWRTDVMRAA